MGIARWEWFVLCNKHERNFLGAIIGWLFLNAVTLVGCVQRVAKCCRRVDDPIREAITPHQPGKGGLQGCFFHLHHHQPRRHHHHHQPRHHHHYHHYHLALKRECKGYWTYQENCLQIILVVNILFNIVAR